LKIGVSSKAKNKIRQWFKRQQREENVTKGRELIEAEVKKLGFEPKEVINEKTLEDVTRKFNFGHEEDMYAAVGYHGLTAAQVAHKLTEKLRKDKETKNLELNEAISGMKTLDKPTKPNPEGVRVKGVDNMLVRMSRCCNPVPGDDIIGYITRGRGVSIHRTDCLNVIHEQNPERLLEVEVVAKSVCHHGHDIGGDVHPSLAEYLLCLLRLDHALDHLEQNDLGDHPSIPPGIERIRHDGRILV